MQVAILFLYLSLHAAYFGQIKPMAWFVRKCRIMKRCHQCGNTYDKCFEVTIDNETYTFDSFECAIHSLAPACACCGCRILGHGVEGDGAIYCCAYCARAEGVEGLVDNLDSSPMVR